MCWTLFKTNLWVCTAWYKLSKEQTPGTKQIPQEKEGRAAGFAAAVGLSTNTFIKRTKLTCTHRMHRYCLQRKLYTIIKSGMREAKAAACCHRDLVIQAHA